MAAWLVSKVPTGPAKAYRAYILRSPTDFQASMGSGHIFVSRQMYPLLISANPGPIKINVHVFGNDFWYMFQNIPKTMGRQNANMPISRNSLLGAFGSVRICSASPRWYRRTHFQHIWSTEQTIHQAGCLKSRSGRLYSTLDLFQCLVNVC